MAGQLTSIEFLTFAILKKGEIFMNKICKKRRDFHGQNLQKNITKNRNTGLFR